MIIAAAGLGACHRNKPAVVSPAAQAQDTAALRRAREDSVRSAQEAEARARAAADEAARARALAATNEATVEKARAVLAAPIYFDYDEAVITDASRATLDQKIALLRANPDLRLRIEGNADERGSEEYNLALGMRRAEAARQYILGYDIASNRLGTVSNGEDKPANPGHDEAAWAQNRRDDFTVVAGGERITTPGQ